MVGSKINKEKQSILIYTSSDFPYGMAPENFVRMMSLGLEYHKQNIKIIRIYGSSFDYNNDTNIKCTNFLFKRKVKNEFLKFLELILIIFSIPISILKNKILKRNNVIILYGIEYFYLVFPFWIFTKCLNIKLFRFITDYYDTENISPTWWKKPKSFFYNFQLKYFDIKLKGIICLSHYMSDFLKKYIKYETKLLVIPHFIDLNILIKNNKIGKENDIFFIGFSGTPMISNGFEDLIEAFKIFNNKYKNSKLLLFIGKQDNLELDVIFNNYFDIKDNLILPGFLNKNEVSNILSNCDVLVNPRQKSIWSDSGFPTKLGEYFALKKPVITTKVGDLINYFEDKKEVIFAEPNSPISISESIEFVINNKEISKKIGENGFNWAKENLDYISNAEKLIKFLNKS